MKIFYGSSTVYLWYDYYKTKCQKGGGVVANGYRKY